MKLKGQLAVVTGAGSGIGRAIAFRFATEGARVVIAELDETAGTETARLIQDRGGDALALTTDVASRQSVASLFSALDQRDRLIDILVNNAGNAEGGLRPIHEMSDEQWDAIIRVHLNGTFYCTREAITRMLPRGRGVVINLGSVAGLDGMAGAASYTAAKGAVIALTKGVSQEVAPAGIRVNCIAPGFVNTPILDKLPAKLREGMVGLIPLGRIGEPEEIAATALFLACDDSGFITGQVISPNGGMYR